MTLPASPTTPFPDTCAPGAHLTNLNQHLVLGADTHGRQGSGVQSVDDHCRAACQHRFTSKLRCSAIPLRGLQHGRDVLKKYRNAGSDSRLTFHQESSRRIQRVFSRSKTKSTRLYIATFAVALFVSLAACSQSSGALFISTREPEQRDEKKLVVRRDRTTGENLQSESARKLDVVTQSQAVIAVREATKEDAKQQSPFTLTVPAAVATSNIDGELLAAVAVDLGVMSLTNAEALSLSSSGERKTVPDLEESGLGPNSPQLGTTLFSPGTTGNESSSESGSAESSGVIRGDVGRIVEPNRSGEVTPDGQPIDNEPDISDDAPEIGEDLATIEPPSASIPGKSGNDDSAGDSPKSNREDGGKSGDVGAQLSPGDLPEGNPPTDGDPVIAEE